MNNQLVSIIIPAYNRADVLSETLDSIIAQTYTNWECIVVDDGSTDDTEELVKNYVESDNRFIFYNRPKERLKGANTCRNYGFEMSNGEYINWFDSDDIMHNNFLHDKYNVLSGNSELDFCCCLYATFQEDINLGTKPLKPLLLQSTNYIEDYLLHDLAFSTNSPLWRSNFLKGKNLFDVEMVRGQEWDFHLRMLTYQPKYKYLERVLFFVRRGNESISKNAESSIKAQKSVFKYFNNAFNIVNTNVEKNKEVLLQYVFYRQAVNYYTLSTLANGFAGKCSIANKFAFKTLKYCFVAQTNIEVKIKIILGIFTVLFTGKGFRYFHYPHLDKRTNKRPKN